MAAAFAILLAMPGFAATPTSAYRVSDLSGFKVMLSPEIEGDARLRDATLRVLRNQLAIVERLASPSQLAFFRTVPFWIERAQNAGGATYHVSRAWLQENGHNPDKAGGIEISNAANFGRWATSDQPMLILHELAHAFHMLVLGARYEPIETAYRNAIEQQLYVSVDYVHGGRKRAYALVDQREYFAELSEAYFGRNDFFPYERSELRAYDPVGYALVDAIWRTRASDPQRPGAPEE